MPKRHRFFSLQNKLSILVLILLMNMFPGKIQAQNYDTQQNQLLAYNLLLNGIVGGVGGAIHKAPGEKTWKVFLKNFGKGAIGGAVKYAAKYQTYYLRQPNSAFLAPANRLFFFLGHSMTMNASLNQKLLSRYYFNLYGLDMVMNFKDKEQKFLTTRLSLGTVYGVSYFLIVGHKLNLYKSLEYGIYYFDLNPDMKQYAGFATFNCIAMGKNAAGTTYYGSIPHELVHTFQFYDFHPVSNLYTPAMRPVYEKIKGYNTLSKYLKADYEGAFQGLLYLVQPTPKYYRNFFEFEAEHFSDRRYIQR